MLTEVTSYHAGLETLEEGLQIYDTSRDDAQILHHLRA